MHTCGNLKYYSMFMSCLVLYVFALYLYVPICDMYYTCIHISENHILCNRFLLTYIDIYMCDILWLVIGAIDDMIMMKTYKPP